MRRTLAALAAAAMLAAPMAAMPTETLAQPVNIADGLVNVQVGNVTILRNLEVAVAANVVAALCDVADVNALVLAQEADAGRGDQTVNCEATGEPVSIVQNTGQRPQR